MLEDVASSRNLRTGGTLGTAIEISSVPVNFENSRKSRVIERHRANRNVPFYGLALFVGETLSKTFRKLVRAEGIKGGRRYVEITFEIYVFSSDVFALNNFVSHLQRSTSRIPISRPICTKAGRDSYLERLPVRAL